MADDDEASWVSRDEMAMHAFDREFTAIPRFVRDDLSSLEREGVLYTDHWIEELDDFRHVRISFTPDEVADFVRRSWAYELFLRAESPMWARDAPGIDREVADEADRYVLLAKDGTVIQEPPCHCFAAFLGPHLEALSCGRSERETIIELQGKASVLFTLDRALEALTPAIRSFNRREAGLKQWRVSAEDDVRDLLYVMLRPSLLDVVKEEPTPSVGGTHKFVDLCSKASRLLIELKWIGRPRAWKRIVQEIQVDIQTYVAHPACATLVFVVVDAVRDIPDPRFVEREISGRQELKGKVVDVRLRIVEP